ncbi:unnamed protein product [Bursaphelenchus xylophilus]|uniref:(pine wood nematode) hypothetical protein n=1 Tax=Bursaphelenchus xylophilus TaxID=6326 RepID=A0A7I8WXT7_BURXY|nr:unnamed protein product [Bursaphelenchus xylophilus]CAG9100577.1 unnamed protein product [Bursaphelenchus xylophilus]
MSEKLPQDKSAAKEEWKTLPSLRYTKYDLGNIALTALVMAYSKLVSMSSEKNVVLPSEDPLLNISAVKAADEIRQGKLKSFDLVSAYLKRIRDVDHFINAVTELFEAEALNRAKEVDDYLDKIRNNPEEIEKIKSEKPLLGLPISVKSSFDYKGYRNVCGLAHRRHLPPAENHSVAVDRVINAGAIPICYTNVPPGCMAFETHNPVYGRTSNPHDTRATSGGSSGGEGALISAQGSLFGIGTDLGGSIRIPSALNGIYGLKTGITTCPLDGHQPNVSVKDENRGLLVIGPMCRYAEDLPLLHQVLSGITIPRPLETLKPSAVFYSLAESKPLIKIADHVKEHVHNNRQFNVLKEFFKCVLGSSEISAVTLGVCYGSGANLSNESVEEAERHVKVIRKHLEDTLGDNGILIFPGMPETHYFHNGFALPASAYTAIFNAMSLPSLAVPCGRCEQGYPISVQIVGSHGSEPLLMAAAAQMEERFGGWVKPIQK